MERIERGLLIFIAGYFLVGMSAWRGQEIFPFCAWDMFCKVPMHQTISLRSLELHRYQGQDHDPPQPATAFPELRRRLASSTSRTVLRRLDDAFEAGDTAAIEQLDTLIRADILRDDAVYSLVELKCNPIEYRKTGAHISKVALGSPQEPQCNT